MRWKCGTGQYAARSDEQPMLGMSSSWEENKTITANPEKRPNSMACMHTKE